MELSQTAALLSRPPTTVRRPAQVRRPPLTSAPPSLRPQATVPRHRPMCRRPPGHAATGHCVAPPPPSPDLWPLTSVAPPPPSARPAASAQDLLILLTVNQSLFAHGLNIDEFDDGYWSCIKVVTCVVELVLLNLICFFMLFGLWTQLIYELILYLNFYGKSEKTFQRSFKRLNVKKSVHNVLMFYRFNNHDLMSCSKDQTWKPMSHFLNKTSDGAA
jgi:hypothetical protein